MKYLKTKIFLIYIFVYLIVSKVWGLQVAAGTGILVHVTERVPWGNCVPHDERDGIWVCEIERWFGSIMNIFWALIQYFTFIALLWAVLFLVINGVLYSMSWLNEGLKSAAKDRIVKTLIWLILLLMSWWILNTLAPWIYE